MDSPIRAKVARFDRHWVHFEAEKSGSRPITSAEALEWQERLGYHPHGYGFGCFLCIQTDSGWKAAWKCSRNCD